MTESLEAPSGTDMDMIFGPLAARLRTARSLLEVAGAVIGELAATGYVGTGVVAFDARGAPAAWVGADDVDPVAARAYLVGDRADHPFGDVRRTAAPIACGDRRWLAPILACGDVIGVISTSAPDEDDRRAELAVVGWLSSIRLAALGVDAPLVDHLRPQLTHRQQEVAQLVARGCTNPEIARMLDISANAVKKHVSRMLERTGTSNRTELAAQAGRWHPPPPGPPRIHVVEAPKPATRHGSPVLRAAI